MGLAGKITRRAFLIGTAAIAGGVAYGYYKVNTPYPNPLLDDLEDGEAALTSYIKIDQSGITLVTPRIDMGQGAFSMQAALIAEELDVELDQIKVDPGEADPAYYNSVLGEDSAPFRSTDESFTAETARTVMASLMKLVGAHITGGSSSVPDSYIKLRTAGAVARETLKVAASKKTGIDVKKLKTEKGYVLLPDGKKLNYIELAPLAAKTTPVSEVTLRAPSQWKLVGKPMQRVDIVAKSTGTAVYGIDLSFENMVHATVKLNPRQGGGMKSYDASAAEKMRGVKKIIPLQDGVGIIADNTWRAMKASEAITFDWGPAPYPAEIEGHWDALKNSFTDDHLDTRNRNDGDVEAALKEGNIIEAEYKAPYLAHAPLEPINAVVKVTDNRVDIWTGTQIPVFLKEIVSKATGISTDKIHVYAQMIGGSFGHRLEGDVVKYAALLAKEIKGIPVKLTYSREEDMAHDYRRQISLGRGQGTVKDGKVVSYDLGIAMPSVTESQSGRLGLPIPGPDLQIIAGAWDQPFKIPNYRVTGYRAKGLAPVSSWRSVGASSNGFFHDSFLDELIHAAGADPMEERIRLCWHEPSRKTLEAVKKMSNWNGHKTGKNQGRGVSLVLSFGVPCAQVIDVTNTEDGIKIDNVFVAADVGRVIDPINFENQVQGAVVWGLGHAMNCEITYSDGMVQQSNFHDFEAMRLYQTPEILVKGLENASNIRGVGEPPVPPAAPALANAIFAATGKRIREMPFNKHIDFV